MKINQSAIDLRLWCTIIGYFAWVALPAQPYDIVIKGGHVYDPVHNVDGIFDVAISGAKITAIAQGIPDSLAKKIVIAEGFWVVPGLIDIHTHVFVGTKPKTFADGINSLSPDNFTFKAGITTVVDAGTAGWKNFPKFKTQVIDQSKTRVLSFVNIAGSGMVGKPEEEDIKGMIPTEVKKLARKYPEFIVGVKIGHFEGSSWLPFERALEASALIDKPLFVECHLPQYKLSDQLARMRPGDIITHSFEQISERAPIIDQEGHLLPEVREARDRGIFFDVGHGGAGFWFDQAIPAFEQDLWPHTFGSDLHRFSVNRGMKDMLNIMSKYLAIGMPIRDVIRRATQFPAQAIRRPDLGHLGVGAEADIAVLRLRPGSFGYVDAAGQRIKGEVRLEAELTLRSGQVVWDLNGLAAKPFKRE